MAKHLRIAVADSDAGIRRYYDRILPQMGHVVVGEATSNAELRDLCRRDVVDLVIVDEMLPGLRGISATKDLARELAVPVVVVSSSDALQEDFQDESCSGVQCLAKPFKTGDLESAIDSAGPCESGVSG